MGVSETKKTIRVAVAKMAQEQNVVHTPAQMESALNKAVRWMSNAIGGTDWNHENIADSVFAYLTETVEVQASGGQTFNQWAKGQRA